jgi:hypothetical protein
MRVVEGDLQISVCMAPESELQAPCGSGNANARQEMSFVRDWIQIHPVRTLMPQVERGRELETGFEMI